MGYGVRYYEWNSGADPDVFAECAGVDGWE